MARWQTTATYRGKGQKHLLARIKSLISRGVVFRYESGDVFEPSSRWENEQSMVVAEYSEVLLNKPIGIRKAVVAAEQHLGLSWSSNGKVGSHV